MVSFYMKISFILIMFLICINMKASEWVNGMFPGKDLLVDGYCAFLRPTAWIWDSCIPYERGSFPTSFSNNDWCRYCKKEVSFSANILLKQVLSLLEINHFSQPKISEYIFPFRKKKDVPLENTLGFRSFPSRHSKVTLDKSLLILRCSGVRTDLS